MKRQEIELRRKREENNFEYARESLKLQSEENRDHRHHETAVEKNGILLIFFAILLFFSIIIMAMLLNKDQIIIDMIRAAGYAFGGGITGYGIGIQKERLNNKKSKTT